jgi:hypothetical protein
MNNLTVAQHLINCANPIWEDIFEVEIAFKYTIPQDDLEAYGFRTSGNAILDKSEMDLLIVAYHTVDRMVENFRNNIPFRVKTSGLYRALDLITNYIDAHLSFLSENLNARAPIDDLLLMDRLAAKLHDAALEFAGQRKEEKASGLYGGRKTINLLETSEKTHEAPRYIYRKPQLMGYIGRNIVKEVSDDD